jgi:hypothetical protein
MDQSRQIDGAGQSRLIEQSRAHRLIEEINRAEQTDLGDKRGQREHKVGGAERLES